MSIEKSDYLASDDAITAFIAAVDGYTGILLDRGSAGKDGWDSGFVNMLWSIWVAGMEKGLSDSADDLDDGQVLNRAMPTIQAHARRVGGSDAPRIGDR